MSKFRVVINFQNGETEELEELYDSYEDAEYEALEYISDWHTGGEILELSNPGDYPYDPDDAPDYDIFEELSNKAGEIIILVENLINKNSTVPLSQEEFQLKYDEYDKEHTKLVSKIEKLENEMIRKKAQAKHLKAFVDDLASRPSVLEEWDENVWSYLIDRATVNNDESITFLFRNGKEINVK